MVLSMKARVIDNVVMLNCSQRLVVVSFCICPAPPCIACELLYPSQHSCCRLDPSKSKVFITLGGP